MQENTDERIFLGPGEACCYCWRTHKIKQVINWVDVLLWHCSVRYYKWCCYHYLLRLSVFLL